MLLVECDSCGVYVVSHILLLVIYSIIKFYWHADNADFQTLIKIRINPRCSHPLYPRAIIKYYLLALNRQPSLNSTLGTPDLLRIK